MNLRSDIQYGILCGAGMCVWILIEYALGFHTSSPEIGQYSGFVSMIIPVVVIFTALHDRQIAAQAPLSVLDGITTGFRIAVISALILTAFLFIYTQVINPEWLDLTVAWQRKQLIVSGASDDEIGKFMEYSRQRNTPFAQIIMGFLITTGLGVFTTLIEIPLVRIFFRKQ